MACVHDRIDGHGIPFCELHDDRLCDGCEDYEEEMA